MQAMEKSKKTKIIVKSPTQERSRQTVSTILDACARLLVTEGFYAITTDKIAKEAGVSIGSLYQFFGNKESVVQAVVKNLLEEDKQMMTEGMRTISPLAPAQRIQGMVQLALEIVRKHAELRAKLTTIQYYVADAAYISETIRFFKDIVQQNLPALPGRDMGKVSYVVVSGFMGLVNTMNIDQPSFINDTQLLEEITTFIFKYLELDKFLTEKAPAKGDFI